MRHDHLFFSWLIRCGSEERAHTLRQGLEASPLTSVTFQDTVRAFHDGSEIRQTRAHVVGDYFSCVKILPEPSPGSFQILFQRKTDAPRYWKDVMMYVLRMVRDRDVQEESPPVEIVLQYRGDAYPTGPGL